MVPVYLLYICVIGILLLFTLPTIIGDLRAEWAVKKQARKGGDVMASLESVKFQREESERFIRPLVMGK